MQRTVVMSGIGGQGIVLGTTLLGHAVTRNGHWATHYAQYGGEMRGTKCECTLSISEEQINAPPLVSRPDVAIIMHPNPPTRLHGTAAESFQAITSTIKGGGLALVNSSLLDPAELEFRTDIEWLLIPATDIGKDLGHLMIATMVAIAAFTEETGLVPLSYVRQALADVIPPYRHKLLEMDDAGLTAGQRAVQEDNVFVASRDARGKVEHSRFPDSSARSVVRIPAVGEYMFRHEAAVSL